MTAPTFEQVSQMTGRYRAHLHYGTDDKGRMITGFQYQLKELPRIQFVDVLTGPAKVVRWWFVDGVMLDQGVAGLQAAIAAVREPPVLTSDEIAALALIPPSWAPLRVVEDDIAGCERPTPGWHAAGSPHSHAVRVISLLRDKGFVEIDRRLVDPDRSTNPNSSYPTIRRRP